MPTYRKGEDQTGLEQAAKEQATVRKNTSPVAKGRAGLGGGGQPYLSNLNVNKAGAYSKGYGQRSGKNEEPPIIHQSGVAVSGLQVAERAKKMLADEHLSKKLSPVKKIGNKKAAFGEMGSGRIKSGVLQPSKSSSPKKKTASWADTSKALKGGHINAEEAADLSPKKMAPTVSKAKKKK
jgi:hypothetical protein